VIVTALIAISDEVVYQVRPWRAKGVDDRYRWWKREERPIIFYRPVYTNVFCHPLSVVYQCTKDSSSGVRKML